MEIISQTKPIPVATPEMRGRLLQAMAKSNNRAQDLVGYFVGAEFSLIPTDGYNIWAAQRGDVTVLVWERGTNPKDWIAKIQCW